MRTLPDSKAQLYFPFLTAAMDEREINTLLRMAAFLAQVGHESLDLLYMQEIASGAAYEGRADLGNTSPGDGMKYKGRGPLQLTGKANFTLYGTILGLDLVNNPEQAATPQVGFRIATLFWTLNKLNYLADEENTKLITKIVNGGFNGLDDRMRRYALAKQILSQGDQ
jgi:putative chitinase